MYTNTKYQSSLPRLSAQVSPGQKVWALFRSELFLRSLSLTSSILPQELILDLSPSWQQMHVVQEWNNRRIVFRVPSKNSLDRALLYTSNCCERTRRWKVLKQHAVLATTVFYVGCPLAATHLFSLVPSSNFRRSLARRVHSFRGSLQGRIYNTTITGITRKWFLCFELSLSRCAFRPHCTKIPSR